MFKSDDETAEGSSGTLVKTIHDKVIKVKNDVNMEVEYMTLLERDREKIAEGREEGREEGIKLTKKVLKLFSNGETIENIAKACEISVKTVKEIIE
ncbi:MAG: hypothetical protein RR891_12315 [Clostridium sp.]|uniref:hypothetical protein n=1 Tax=Clostridium sp. TaxID=1506 RepID=UPI00303226DB